MKILLIGRPDEQSSCRFVKKAFEYRNHEVKDLDQIDTNNFKADFIFLIKPNGIDLRLFQKLSQHAPIIFYFYDAFNPNKKNFVRSLKIANLSEIVLTANEEGARYFSQINPNTYILRQACNHVWLDIYSETLPSQRNKPFFFAGSANLIRNSMISDIRDWASRNNKKFDEFGEGYGKTIPLNDLSKVTTKYQLCFNLPSSPTFDYISNRIYNTMGTNTPIISWNGDELKKLFTDDQNIIFFENKRMMYDKLNFYFENLIELDRIAINAKKLILEKHTWDKRVQQVIQIFKNHFKGVKI